MQRAFLNISLRSVHDYDVKGPIFTFTWTQDNEFCFLFLTFDSLRIQLQKKLPTYDELNEVEHMRNEVWSNATSLFNWRFRSLCRPCCLSPLILLMPITRPYSLWNLTNREFKIPRQRRPRKKSLKKWICVLLISIAITPTHLLCQIQASSFWAEFLRITFKFRKRKKN